MSGPQNGGGPQNVGLYNMPHFDQLCYIQQKLMHYKGVMGPYAGFNVALHDTKRIIGHFIGYQTFTLELKKRNFYRKP